MGKVAVGIDLGGTSTKLSLVKSTGEIVDKWNIPTDTSEAGSKIIPNIIQSLKQKISELNVANSDIIGIGMGAPGAINRNEGTVSGAYNLNWVEVQPVQSVFEASFGVPFFIDNDANVAALGEKWRGSGNNLKNVVFITLGTGVGGGVIITNQLLTGNHGCAGEIGHIHVSDNPIFQCTCGNQGCLESVASATGMIHLSKYLAQEHEGSSKLKQTILEKDEITVKEVFDAAKVKDTLGLVILENFGNYIGLACSHIANILDPDKIIVGGGIAAAGSILLSEIFETYHKYTFPKARDKELLTLARLGNDAGILGAAYLVMSNQKG
jgi:glucokinase